MTMAPFGAEAVAMPLHCRDTYTDESKSLLSCFGTVSANNTALL